MTNRADGITCWADFSPCGTWRYTLGRAFPQQMQGPDPGGMCMFIGLNPSTADETQDDPTIRRCMGFARAWGYDGLLMTNLYALRSTDPQGLLAPGVDATGPANDHWLNAYGRDAATIIAAWGAAAQPDPGRVQHVLGLFTGGLRCLGRTKGGHPRHPLYLRRDTRPEPYG